MGQHYSWFTTQKWSFSIAMWNYHRLSSLHTLFDDAIIETGSQPQQGDTTVIRQAQTSEMARWWKGQNLWVKLQIPSNPWVFVDGESWRWVKICQNVPCKKNGLYSTVQQGYERIKSGDDLEMGQILSTSLRFLSRTLHNSGVSLRVPAWRSPFCMAYPLLNVYITNYGKIHRANEWENSLR